MRVLVLGGTGSMGVSLVKILASRGNEVYITSRSYHHPEEPMIHYIQGNAHDEVFLKKTLEDTYDAIVDFMVYKENEFKERADILLSSTKRYIFLSTSRVYSESQIQMTEDSPRLLDICEDEKYLNTDDYPLSKARQENHLKESQSDNWTVIRPYITYSEQRLQLGIYEKEEWLYRALRGRSIVFPKDIAERITTLTYGNDVSNAIANLIEEKDSMREMIHIASSETIYWRDVLDLYLDVIEKNTHQRPKVFWVDNASEIVRTSGSEYAIKYDRLYNRSFDNKKVNKILGYEIKYLSPRIGLEKCLQEFLDGGEGFKPISWKAQAYMDKLTGEKAPLSEMKTWKEKFKYLICRYTPYFSVFRW